MLSDNRIGRLAQPKNMSGCSIPSFEGVKKPPKLIDRQKNEGNLSGMNEDGFYKRRCQEKKLSRRDRRRFLGIEPSLGSACCRYGRAGDCEDSRLGAASVRIYPEFLRPHKPLWVGVANHGSI